MIFLQSECKVHIFINLNWEENEEALFLKSKRIGKWSDWCLIKVETERDVQVSSQSWLHIALSSLLSVNLLPSLPFDQV